MAEDLRNSLIYELELIRKNNDKLIVMVSDSTSTSKIQPFMMKYPESVINTGIAEQNLIGMAAGMALGGFVPVTANAAPFLMGRSNEQVKNDICYSESNVKLVGLNPGFAYGSLGPTHHCLDDISTALALGNIEIYVPSDPEETRQIVKYAIEHSGPMYIRLDSYKADNIHSENYRFEPGKPVILREGLDITFLALGTMVHTAIQAADKLAEKGIRTEIINLPSIRPLRNEKIIKSLKKTGCVITMEEHSLHGGIGSIIGDIILENRIQCWIKKIGVTTGQFAPASPREDIKEKYNLHTEGIISAALEMMEYANKGNDE